MYFFHNVCKYLRIDSVNLLSTVLFTYIKWKKHDVPSKHLQSKHFGTLAIIKQLKSNKKKDLPLPFNQDSFPITQSVSNTNIFNKLFFAIPLEEFCALISNLLELFLEILGDYISWFLCFVGLMIHCNSRSKISFVH